MRRSNDAIRKHATLIALPPKIVGGALTQLRGSALAVSGATNWVTSFAITLTFLPLLNAVGLSTAYALYALAAVLSLPFVWVFVRETRGKTLEQM